MNRLINKTQVEFASQSIFRSGLESGQNRIRVRIGKNVNLQLYLYEEVTANS